MPAKRLLLTATGVVTLLGVASAQVPPASTPSVASAAPVATAPHPAAAPAVVSPELSQLQADLKRLLDAPAWRQALYGVLVVSLASGDTLFAHNPDLPLAPASNMKLYSTAAALYYLGSNFRYSTYALADGEIRDGVLLGDLVLYGTGDPSISSRMLPGALAPLRALADSLLAQGITEVRGNVVGDGSYFDDVHFGDGWRERYRLASYSAPIGALSLAENVVTIRVSPGAAGEPAVIRTTPATAGLLVQNRVVTVGSGRSSVRFAYDPQGLVVEGQIARGNPGVARTVTVVDPANYAAAAFRDVLEGAGIRVYGSVRTIHDRDESPIGRVARAQASDGDAAIAPRVLGTHLSPTLAEVTSVTNHVSQNLYAEAMFKTVGRVAIGDGTFAAGARAVQYFLECEKPVDFAGVRMVDGSGLSPLNRVTARTTLHLLDLMTRTDVWDAFYNSLPEAASPNGGEHSLRTRMRGTPAARNLRAKTGTISDVSSLSGYVQAANGELLAFSIIGNEVPSTFRAKRLEDEIGVRLARFTRTPPPSLAGVPADSTAPLPVTVPADDSNSESSSNSASDTQSSEEVAAPDLRSHRVRSGDTLDGIARRYGTTVAEIQRLNPDLEPRRLLVGQEVRIPG